MKFQTIIEASGKNTTGIPVPAEVVESLGSGKKPPVKVTIGDYTYRSSIASMDGRYMISLSAENRAAAGVAAGDAVDVEIEVDNEPRQVTVPPDFAEALDKEADARRFFDGLSYSNQLRFVLSVEGAKTPETRQRRIDSAMSQLRAGQKA